MDLCPSCQKAHQLGNCPARSVRRAPNEAFRDNRRWRTCSKLRVCSAVRSAISLNSAARPSRLPRSYCGTRSWSGSRVPRRSGGRSGAEALAERKACSAAQRHHDLLSFLHPPRTGIVCGHHVSPSCSQIRLGSQGRHLFEVSGTQIDATLTADTLQKLHQHETETTWGPCTREIYTAEHADCIPRLHPRLFLREQHHRSRLAEECDLGSLADNGRVAKNIQELSP